MLYYDRNLVSEGTYIKTSSSKECNICHYWYFLDKRFQLQPCGCNGFQDVLMMSMIISNIPFSNIIGADYCCIIIRISKSEAADLLQKADLYVKGRKLWNLEKKFFNIKISKEMLTFGNIDIEKNKFYLYMRPILLGDVDIEKVLTSNKILVRKTINTLLVTCTMIKKLSHYI